MYIAIFIINMCIVPEYYLSISEFLSEYAALPVSLDMRQPLRLGGFLVEPRRYLRDHIAAMGINSANRHEVRAIARGGDGQCRALGFMLRISRCSMALQRRGVCTMRMVMPRHVRR